MSRRRRQNSISPSLFPFLAVLVCTMGTLILLLALLSQNSKAEAASTDQAPPPAVTEVAVDDSEQRLALMQDQQQLEIDRDQYLWRQEILRKRRTEQTAELEERRDRLAHLEDSIRELTDKLSTLSREIQSALDTPSDQIQDQSVDLSAQIAELEKKIEEEKRKIVELEDAAPENDQPRIVIVPHKGPGGTDRRPIYIECLPDQVIVHPENVTIQIEHLMVNENHFNPLASALRALRSYWNQNDPLSPPPYPLLIVRPGGAKAYNLARFAMRDWDDQFGYELVPKEVKLGYPSSDPYLKKLLDRVVRIAIAGQGYSPDRNSRLALSNGSRRDAGGSRQSGSTIRRTSGGSRPGGSLPPLTASNMDPRSAGRLSSTDGFPRDGFPSTGLPRDASSTGYPGSEGLDKPTLPAFDSTAGQSFAANRGGEPMGESLAQNNSYASENAGSLSGGAVQDPDRQTLNEELADSPRMRSASSVAHQYVREPTASSNPGQPNMAPSSMASNLQQTQNDDLRLDKEFFNDTDPPTFEMPEIAKNANAETLNAASSMLRENANQQSTSNSTDQQQSQQASPTLQAIQNRQRNWALPSSLQNQRGSAVVRMIDVDCYSDQFILLPDRPSDGVTKIPISMSSRGDGIAKAIVALVDQLHSRIDRWGASIPGGYWEPTLRVRIADPSAKQRFHQLEYLMKNSGIQIIKR